MAQLTPSGKYSGIHIAGTPSTGRRCCPDDDVSPYSLNEGRVSTTYTDPRVRSTVSVSFPNVSPSPKVPEVEGTLPPSAFVGQPVVVDQVGD